MYLYLPPCPDCLTDVVAKIKVYKKAGNQLRMAKRIASWKKVMDKKKEKASSNFTDAAEAMEAATGGGASCNGAAPDADVAADLAKLKNCSVSAAALCDSAMINDSNIESCKTNFEAFTAAFDVNIARIYLHQIIKSIFPPAGMSEGHPRLLLLHGAARPGRHLRVRDRQHRGQGRQEEVQQPRRARQLRRLHHGAEVRCWQGEWVGSGQ